MKFYRLTLSDHVKMPIKAPGLPSDMYLPNITQEGFQAMPEGIVAYYRYSDDVEVPDILMEPTMMVSKDLRSVLSLYNPEIKAKSVKMFAVEEEISLAPEYWVLSIPEVYCLSDEVEVLPNGAVEKLILQRNAIGKEDVFKVEGTLENYVIVSTPVVESILRRKLYGVGFQEVEVR